MKKSCRLLDEEKVIVHASAGDEGALIDGDNFPHPRCELEQQDLGKQLCQDVNQADGPVVGERGGIGFLGKKCEKCLVKLVESAFVHGVELVESLTNVGLDDGPSSAEVF